MACRRLDVAEASAGRIMRTDPKGKVETMALDLGDLASVRSFAAEFLSRYDQLHGLVNNAGVMNTPQSTTSDGFEIQFGVNHLGLVRGESEPFELLVRDHIGRWRWPVCSYRCEDYLERTR